MKTAEAKPTSVATSQKANQPFFSKEAEGSFFGESVNKEPSFFKKASAYSVNSKGVLQTKLTIGQPNDVYEKEADSMADKVVQRLSDPSSIQTKSNSIGSVTSFVQKKCAHCEEEEKLQKKEKEDTVKEQIQKKPIFESNAEQPDDSLSIGEGRGEVQRKCAECEEEEKLQKKSDFPLSIGEGRGEVLESKLSSSKGSGSPLPAGTRSQMESSFGSDFSNVRIHNDSSSVQMNQDLNAQAFTHGSDIYFNEGKYNTSHTGGKHLLAHELTHVVQQNGGKEIQKQGEPVQSGSNDGNSQGVFLVDDNTSPSERQMNKTTFLERLKVEVCQTVDEAIKFAGSTSDNCPYIREVFARYQNNTPAQIEAVIQRYEPSTRFAQSADDMIQMVKAHAFTAAIQWAANGVIPGLPESITSLITTGIASVSNVVSTISSTVNNAISSITSGISSAVSDIGSGIGNAVSSIGNLFFKSKPGGSQATHSPLGVMQSLGKGNPISSGTRNKMESAFGTSFSHVQLHTDSKASALSGSMNARAFAVGNHIAFGSGEYQPGTLVGDALMAHELAHVEQQKDNGLIKSNSESDLESDVDKSMFKSFSESGNIKKIFPKLKSGLRISRCSKPAKKPLLEQFAEKFPDSADIIKKSPSSLLLVKEASDAGVEFGGFSEDGPGKWAWPYTSGNKVYVPKSHQGDKVLATSDFLFELNNGIRKPKFQVFNEEAAKGSKGTLDAKSYARKNVELEVEGMLRTGEAWFELKKSAPKGENWNKYDSDFFLQSYLDYKAGTKTKDDIVNSVLSGVYPEGVNKGKTTEQYYMEQYKELSGDK